MKGKDKSNDLIFPAKREMEVIGSAVEAKAKDKPLLPSVPIETHTFDYEVIKEISLDELKARVKTFLRNGWECTGGATYSPKMGIWYQTVVIKI